MRTFIAALTAACALGAVPASAQSVPKRRRRRARARACRIAVAVPLTVSAAVGCIGVCGGVVQCFVARAGTAGFSFANGGASRVFDTISRQPMLNAINVQLQKNGAVFGKVELTAGTNANVIASYPYANNPNPLQTAFDVTQLYAGFTSGPFAVQAGKFETLAGAEVIEDPANANISRSILFGYAIPFTHTGARLTYTASSLISLIAGVNNGWDNLKGPGGPKTAELGLAYNGSRVLAHRAGYLGMERYSNAQWSATGDSPAGHRALVDVVGTYHATPKLTFVGNVDSGRQTAVPLVDSTGAFIAGPLGVATWNGFAGYAQYQITDRSSRRRCAARRSTITAGTAPASTSNGARRRSRSRTRRRHRSCSASKAAPTPRTTPCGRTQSLTLRNAMQSVAAQVLVKF